MQFRKRFISIISISLIMVMLCFSPSNELFFAEAATASQMKSQLSELQKKQDALKKEIANLKKDITNKQLVKNKIKEQISNTQEQIDLYNNEISSVSDNISSLEIDIISKQTELDENKELFKKRLRALYITGSNSTLQVLLSANDFADFLYKTQLMNSISERDSQIMDQLKNDLQSIDDSKNSVENSKLEVETLKQNMAAKNTELNSQLKELNSLLTELTTDQNDLQKENAEVQKAKAKLEQQIADAAKAAENSKIVYNGSDFLWPVPGYYKISSYYRTKSRPTHNGIDISSSGIYGKNIVAVADGKVILAGNNGNGYGIYVMIDHGKKDGKSYTTLYAHCSSISVKKGDTVKAGQVIGKIGSTGNSTGPHLHYEIRVNGNPTNPISYYKLS